MLQGFALQVFHDQVRHVLQIARGHKAGHVRAGQHLQQLVFHLEADDVLGPVTRCHARHFHGHGEARVSRGAGVIRRRCIVHPVDVGHATGVDALVNLKTVQQPARLQQFHRPSSNRSAKYGGKSVRRMAAAAAS